MSEVLAVIEAEDPESVVIDLANAVASVVRAQVRRVELADGLGGEQGAALVLREMSEPGTLLAVLGRHTGAGSTWPLVVPQASKPVVVVPQATPQSRPGITRVLVPLDGTAEAAGAVADTVALFAGVGVEVVVLHVFDAATTPLFWDQPAYERQEWDEEFLARYCSLPGVRLTLRSGPVGQHVVDVATTEQADLITLGWSQQLDPGRAQTVRHAVLAASVPVMLVPLALGK